MEDRETLHQREAIPATPGFWNIIAPKGKGHIHWYTVLYKAKGVNSQITGALPAMASC